jgi:hypothetical protein
LLSKLAIPRTMGTSESVDQSLNRSVVESIGTLEAQQAFLNPAPAQVDEKADGNLVDFDDGPDPENPQSWSPGRKWGLIVLVSLMEFAV